MALINNKPRIATIICDKNSHFAILKKKEFEDILKQYEEAKFMGLLEFLNGKHIFSTWSFEQLKILYLNSELKNYRIHEKIFEEGDYCDYVYIIKQGDFI